MTFEKPPFRIQMKDLLLDHGMCVKKLILNGPLFFTFIHIDLPHQLYNLIGSLTFTLHLF